MIVTTIGSSYDALDEESDGESNIAAAVGLVGNSSALPSSVNGDRLRR